MLLVYLGIGLVCAFTRHYAAATVLFISAIMAGSARRQGT